jgi:lycopene beta-cyclase
MSSIVYDYAIVGAGAAGLHLALAMQEDAFFKDKKILILEKDGKDKNDRNWSFWEKNAGKWDDIILKSWPLGDFHCLGEHKELDLLPYKYKMLRGLDFYNLAKKRLLNTENFTWVNGEVVDVEDGVLGSPPDPLKWEYIPSNLGKLLSFYKQISSKLKGISSDYLGYTPPLGGRGGEPTKSKHLQIKTQTTIYKSNYVFDSRIPTEFLTEKNEEKYLYLLQHFKGWFIRTPEDFFVERFTMMDYRLLWKENTSFTYVLPLNKREALVEFTLFSEDLLKNEDYDLILKRYIKEILKLENYEITEVEQGVIPMSTFPFEKHTKGNHIRIGTAGGGVKPSSGYSFKNCEKNAQITINNLKNDRNPQKGIISGWFRMFDAIFLEVLKERNDLGPKLFHIMYFKNKAQKIFAFLDEETSVWDNIKIANGFPKLLFTKAFFRYLGRHFR